MQKQYYCPGSCGGVMDVDEWKDETPTCQAEDCELHEQPLKKRTKE